MKLFALVALLLQGGITLTSTSKIVAEFPPEITTAAQALTFNAIIKTDGTDAASRPWTSCAIGAAAPLVTCNLTLIPAEITTLNSIGRHTVTARLVSNGPGGVLPGAESLPIIWDHAPGAPTGPRIQP